METRTPHHREATGGRAGNKTPALYPAPPHRTSESPVSNTSLWSRLQAIEGHLLPLIVIVERVAREVTR
jgi:hypothetical protein